MHDRPERTEFCLISALRLPPLKKRRCTMTLLSLQSKWLSHLIAPMIAAGIASACASAGEDRDRVRSKERTCIHVSSINGFNPIDPKHLTISVGASKTYLVTLFSRCRELNWSEKIAIKSHSSWTCSNSKDRILVDGDRCMISKIELVENRKAARELVEKRNPKRSRSD